MLDFALYIQITLKHLLSWSFLENVISQPDRATSLLRRNKIPRHDPLNMFSLFDETGKKIKSFKYQHEIVGMFYLLK